MPGLNCGGNIEYSPSDTLSAPTSAPGSFVAFCSNGIVLSYKEDSLSTSEGFASPVGHTMYIVLGRCPSTVQIETHELGTNRRTVRIEMVSLSRRLKGSKPRRDRQIQLVKSHTLEYIQKSLASDSSLRTQAMCLTLSAAAARPRLVNSCCAASLKGLAESEVSAQLVEVENWSVFSESLVFLRMPVICEQFMIMRSDDRISQRMYQLDCLPLSGRSKS